MFPETSDAKELPQLELQLQTNNSSRLEGQYQFTVNKVNEINKIAITVGFGSSIQNTRQQLKSESELNSEARMGHQLWRRHICCLHHFLSQNKCEGLYFPSSFIVNGRK